MFCLVLALGTNCSKYYRHLQMGCVIPKTAFHANPGLLHKIETNLEFWAFFGYQLQQAWLARCLYTTPIQDGLVFIVSVHS